MKHFNERYDLNDVVPLDDEPAVSPVDDLSYTRQPRYKGKWIAQVSLAHNNTRVEAFDSHKKYWKTEFFDYVRW